MATPRCVIKGPKKRIGCHLGTCVGVSMIGIKTTQPCPVARVIDFMTAFRKVNENWLMAMQAKCRQDVKRLGRDRRGQNGEKSLKTPLAQWFLPACELTLIEAVDGSGNYLEEDEHMDGSMSLFHVGLTLGGARDSFCVIEGFGRVCVRNSLGTIYIGNLIGPRHQVFHRPCEEHDLPFVPGLGRRSVTVIMRIVLFPCDRSRHMEQLPKPKSLWTCLKNHMVDAVQMPGLRLPILEEGMEQIRVRVHQDAVAASSQDGDLPVPSAKKRRLRGKATKAVI